MKMKERTADAQFARKLADIVAPVPRQPRHDPQPMRIGEGRKRGQQLVACQHSGMFLHTHVWTILHVTESQEGLPPSVSRSPSRAVAAFLSVDNCGQLRKAASHRGDDTLISRHGTA